MTVTNRNRSCIDYRAASCSIDINIFSLSENIRLSYRKTQNVETASCEFFGEFSLYTHAPGRETDAPERVSARMAAKR